MTYLWPEGEPIGVEVDPIGTPRRFLWRGRSHSVELITNRWRIDEDWWRGRIWREYFKLATHSGLLVIVYRDLAGKEWFLQQLYD